MEYTERNQAAEGMENVENKKHDDTEKLLRECNAGIKMGVSSIDEVLPSVHDCHLKGILEKSRREHADLGDDTHGLLLKYDCDTKEPHPVAKSMSWIKTNVKLMVDPSDKTVADLMTDGCNMGIKSINGYLNEYTLADSRAQKIAGKLIDIEQRMVDALAEYV